jgi:aminopeptidase N
MSLLIPFCILHSAFCTLHSDSLLAPGISRQLAEYRAKTIGNVSYDLRLDLTSRDSAPGRVVIRFDRRDTADLILDFRGKRLGGISANGAEVPAAQANDGHIRVPRAALKQGPNELVLEFVAAIAPSGASIIRFDDRDDGNTYLYTLLVPADANQLFPSFDQPDLKGRVTLTLRTPPGWTAIANGRPDSSVTEDGGQVHHFQPTRPISTYLIAFAAGPWHRVSGTVNGRTINAYVRQTRAKEADLDTLIAINRRGLDWMERYFGRPYPFEKYDFVLAPAFPFGGMEHPGAVFYSEERFVFRERPTLPRRLGRMSTVLHEVAHMWFGDLVTMRWFDDLWLKEGFATYMAAKALSDLEPESNAWKTFHLANKPPAYGVDQTAGTTPVWQELPNLDQAKSNYGPIVYNKAPSILKQLEFTVGDSGFRGGVRAFLTMYAYGNATWRDLLRTVGAASGRSLDEWGRQYMLRPGLARVEQQLTVRNGKIERLALVQSPAQKLSGLGDWPIRTQVVLAWPDSSRLTPVELRGSITEVATARGLPAPAFVFANAGDHGYFLTLLDSASVRHLESGGLGKVRDAFLRAMLWTALWDQVRAGRMAPERFARLAIRELPGETDEQIVPVQLGRLGRVMAAYLPPLRRSALQREVETLLASGAGSTDRPYGVRKAYLDAFIELATTPDAVSDLVALLSADSAAGEPLRDPTRWDAVTRLLILEAPDAERHLAAQTARDTTPDGRRRAFMAGAGRPSATVKQEYFTRYFADTTLNEDWATASLGPFNAIAHQRLTRPYLVPALDSLLFIQANRRIFFLGSWLGAFLSGQTEPEALQIVRDWMDQHPDLAVDIRRKVLQYVDELERTVAISGRLSADS